LIREDINPTTSMSGVLIKKINNACCQGRGSFPCKAGYINELITVNVGEMIMKNMKEMISVESKRYLIFPAYVSFGTPNKAVNHLPIAVNGIKLEITRDKIKAITKLVTMFSQSIVANEIVRTPSTNVD
jgi:hypothetical protein